MDRQLKEAMYANVTKSIPFLQGLEPEVVGNLGVGAPRRCVCVCVRFRAVSWAWSPLRA
jgi:hypothetical protein